MKATDQMGWVRALNSIRSRADRQRLRRDPFPRDPAAFRASCEVSFTDGSPTVHNDEKAAAHAYEAVRSVLVEGVYNAGKAPFFASDDFARYAQLLPSVYFMLATNNPAKGITHTDHSDAFDLDEDVLYRGAAALTAIVLR